MTYVQGFVIPVPIANQAAYQAMAAASAPIFIDHGAERIVECWGADVRDGKTTDFRRAVLTEAGETVVFSWIVWPDRATADAAEANLRTDPRMAALGEMPFDGARMIYGGFVPIYDSAG